MEYLKLGTIIKTRGLKGQVKVYSTTEFAVNRYKKGNFVILKNQENDDIKEFEIESFSTDGQFDYLTFKGYNTIESITPFIKYDILIIKEENPLPNNMYYHQDLINCEVFNNNICIGKVIEIEEFTSKKSLRILLKNNKTLLLPFIDVFIKKVDIKNKKIDVTLIKGMIEE